jgi:hypothetical protein
VFHRERSRRSGGPGLAIAPFLLPASEVGAARRIVSLGVGAANASAIDDLRSIFPLVFTPTAALFEAAAGFYHGAKTEAEASS